MNSQTRPAMTRLLDDISVGNLGDLMLTEQDFPGHYVNMAHPQDYIARAEPLQPELFYNRRANHFRLLLRASLALPDKSFLPMTFVCDSGAPGGYFFSERAMKVLSRSDVERLKEDDLHNLYLQTEVGEFAVTDTPQRHHPANIVGLRVLEKYGLVISERPKRSKSISSFFE